MAFRRTIFGRYIALLFMLLLCQCNGETNSTSNDTGTDKTISVDAGGESNPEPKPYADVTAVTTTGAPDDYDVFVTVESADIDCSQYADWWEVLSESGVLIYRRILAHSHTDANGTGNPFTRNGGPVAISKDQIVVIRAHMNTVGYVGMAVRGSVSGGFTEAPDIGPSFAPNVEDEDPQPETCLF